MPLFVAAFRILEQLSDVVAQISDADYRRPTKALGGSTIGQHLRHTLEFFCCLEKGLPDRLINYDRRAHDRTMETDRCVAQQTIEGIRCFLSEQKNDVPLKLGVGYLRQQSDALWLDSTYYRELAYNIEHAVHHMALMKVAMGEHLPELRLPEDFGIAVSTLRYREALEDLTSA